MPDGEVQQPPVQPQVEVNENALKVFYRRAKEGGLKTPLTEADYRANLSAGGDKIVRDLKATHFKDNDSYLKELSIDNFVKKKEQPTEQSTTTYSPSNFSIPDTEYLKDLQSKLSEGKPSHADVKPPAPPENKGVSLKDMDAAEYAIQHEYRKKVEEYNDSLRDKATGLTKAAYYVADDISNYMASIPTNIFEGTQKLGEAMLKSPLFPSASKNPSDWKDNTLDALNGAMQAILGVAQVIPATAGAMAIYGTALPAASDLTKNLKEKYPDNGGVGNLYNAVRLATDPYGFGRESYGYFTGQDLLPESETEKKVHEFANTIGNLATGLLIARGIRSHGDIPDKYSSDKITPKPKTETESNPQSSVEKNKENESIFNIAGKVKNNVPLDVSELKTAHTIVENSTPEDIKKAAEKTQSWNDKAKANKEQAAKELRIKQAKEKGSILSSKNDLLHTTDEPSPKADWMWMPNTKEGVDNKAATDMQKSRIKTAFNGGDMDNALREGRIGFYDVERLLNAAGIDVPNRYPYKPVPIDVRTAATKAVKNEENAIENKPEIKPTKAEEQAKVDFPKEFNQEVQDQKKDIEEQAGKEEKEEPITTESEYKPLTEDDFKAVEKHIKAKLSPVQKDHMEAENRAKYDKGKEKAEKERMKSVNDVATLLANGEPLGGFSKEFYRYNKDEVDKAVENIKKGKQPPEELPLAEPKQPEPPKGGGGNEQPPVNKDEQKGVEKKDETPTEQVEPKTGETLSNKVEAKAAEAIGGEVKPPTQMGLISSEDLKNLYHFITTSKPAQVIKDFANQFPELNKALKEKKIDVKKYVSRIAEMGKAAAKNTLVKDYFNDYISGKKVADDEPKVQPLAANNVREALNIGYSELGDDVAKQKDFLQKTAAHYDALSIGSPEGSIEKRVNMQTAISLATLHDMIKDPDDLKNILTISSGQPLVKVGDRNLTYRTLGEKKMLDEMAKPSKPLSAKDEAVVMKALQPYALPSEGTFMGQAVDKIGGASLFLLKKVNPQQWAYMYARKQWKPTFKNTFFKTYSVFNGDRNEALFHANNELNYPHITAQYDEPTRKAVTAIAADEHYGKKENGYRYYTPQELAGNKLTLSNGKTVNITPQVRGLYDMLKRQNEAMKADYLNARKTAADYDNLDETAKKSFDENHKFLGDDNGYWTFNRSGDHWVVYHGKDAITGKDATHYSLFETPKEAKAFAANMEKKGYTGVNDAGEPGQPTITIRKKTQINNPALLERLTGKDPFVLERIINEANIDENSKDYQSIMDVVNRYKAQTSNPHFMRSDRAPGTEVTFDNLFKSLHSQRENAIHSLYRQKALKTFNETIAPARESTNLKDVATVKNYDNWMEGLMMHTTNANAFNLVTKAMYLSNLGLKPTFMLQMLYKNILTLMPENIGEGGKVGDVVKYIGKAKDVMNANYFGAKPAEWLTDPNNEMGRDVNRAVIRNTIGDQMQNYYASPDGETRMDKLTKKLNRANGWSTLHLDAFKRTNAFLMAWNRATEKGLTGDARFNYAEDFTHKTNFLYGKANMMPVNNPRYVGKARYAVNTLMTFMNTHVNYAHYFYDDFNNWQKTAAKIAPRFLTGGAGIAGALGAGKLLEAGINIMTTAINNMNNPDKKEKYMLNLNPDVQFSIHCDNAAKSILGDNALAHNLGAFVSHGGLAPFGYDGNKYADLGEFSTESITDPFHRITGLYGSTAQKGYNFLSSLSHGQMQEAAQNIPFAGARTIAQNIIWANHGQKLGNGLENDMTKGDAIMNSVGASQIGMTNYYQSEDFRKAIQKQNLSIKSKVEDKVKEAISKGNLSDIEKYYNDPTTENFNAAFGKDLNDEIDQTRNTVYDVMPKLLKYANLTTDDKLNDVGKWRSLYITKTWDDSSFKDPKQHFSTKRWIIDYFKGRGKNELTDKDAKNNPVIKKFIEEHGIRRNEGQPTEEGEE